jgi:6-phosphogluconolactonase
MNTPQPPEPGDPAPRLYRFADASARVAALAGRIARQLDDALSARGRAVLAVSGGRSPVPLFEALRGMPLDWSRVLVTLVDERLVAPTHPDSNEALVREHLLRERAAQARLLGLVDPAEPQLQHCVRLANQHAIAPDVVVLGMGDDGHTASLFAQAQGIEQAMDQNAAPTYVGLIPPRAPHARISMSLRALLAAPCLLLCIDGEVKRRVYESARSDDASAYPIARLLHHRGTRLETYWSP